MCRGERYHCDGVEQRPVQGDDQRGPRAGEHQRVHRAMVTWTALRAPHGDYGLTAVVAGSLGRRAVWR